MADSAGPPSYRSPRENPWWIPPFLGGIPHGVSATQLRLLGFLTFAMFFENYDLSLLGNALPQIGASFGLSKADLGDFTSATRFGALPAFFLVPLADRIGRRRVLLACVIGMSVGSALTALSQSAVQFVLFQIVTRTFIVTASVVTFVVITEEFPAENRGWGIGMLGGVSAIGFGAGALTYGFVNQLPFGWRALYMIGLLPLLLFPALRKGIVETRRFREHSASLLAATSTVRTAITGAFGPIAELYRLHPRRAIALGLLGGLSAAGTGVAFQFISQFLQTERGWTPGTFAALSVTFGAFGIIGNPVSGRLGDRIGRRAIAAVVLLLFPFCALAFYAGPASLVALPWTAMVFLSMASSVTTRALATELFPTALRGTGGGSLALLETLGVAAGLFVYARGMEWLGSQSLVIPLVSFATVFAALALLLLPETSRRELEEIAQEEPAR
jgi:MFS family permease